jgi:5-formyltetrahydrofolate cyclo-ligase
LQTAHEQGADRKRDVRAEALARRDAIPGPVRRTKDRAVAEQLSGLPEFRAAERVLLYASFRSEVDTAEIIEVALDRGKKVLLPKVDRENGTLSKHVINGMDDVSPGFAGIPEPTTEERLRVEDIDLIVVPGVAFDTGGCRVGYGGGYYDRLLARVKGMRPIVALAYEEQLVDALPREEHDVNVDMIVTDRRVIKAHGR